MTERGVAWPTVVAWLVAVASTSMLLLHLAWEHRGDRDAPEPEAEVPDKLVLRTAMFADLPGWAEDRLAEALVPLRRSCERFATLPDDREVGAAGGVVADWKPLCDRLPGVPAADDQEAREFFETEFLVYSVLNRDESVGLLTGYYEPSISGSRERQHDGQVPLYRRPDDLVSVDLGEFREDLGGRRIAGRVSGSRLEPYEDRARIAGGSLAGRGLEVAWVDSPVDAFFLHIQGSGRVDLPDGQVLRVGYDGQNGHPYFPIGRELVSRGILTLEEVSMQSIRAWLEANPEAASEVMNRNASFIFFRELEGEGPVGSQGVALSPGRSLAVDRQHIPLGAPVWVAGSVPGLEEGTDEPFQRLLIAQDTGGAIKGPVRGDVFWGNGPEAAERAGRMRHEGRMWVLLPRTVTPPPEVMVDGV